MGLLASLGERLRWGVQILLELLPANVEFFPFVVPDGIAISKVDREGISWLAVLTKFVMQVRPVG